MPWFKFKDKIRLQNPANVFKIIGPGIVELSEEDAQHGYIKMVGEPVNGPDGKPRELNEEQEQKAESNENKDLNPNLRPIVDKTNVIQQTVPVKPALEPQPQPEFLKGKEIPNLDPQARVVNNPGLSPATMPSPIPTPPPTEAEIQANRPAEVVEKQEQVVPLPKEEPQPKVSEPKAPEVKAKP